MADQELERDRRRLDELIDEQEALFLSRRPRATKLQRRAEASLAGGGRDSAKPASGRSERRGTDLNPRPT